MKSSINKLKIHFTLILLLIGCGLISGLQSCSEDLDVTPGINAVPEGYLQVSLAVPAPITVNTRAGEDATIKMLDLVIFPKTGDPQFVHYEAPSGTVKVALNGATRNADVTLYAVANVPELSAKKDIIKTQDNLKKYILEKEIKLEEGLPMVGSRSVNTAAVSSANVSLYRTVAQISAISSVAGVTLPEFQVYNYSKTGYLGSPLDETITFIDNKVGMNNPLNSQNDNNSEDTAMTFAYPSKGITDKGKSDGAFVVVKIMRDSKEMYYRLNLRTEKENGELEYINLLPNHHYKIEIEGLMTDGYNSYDEAVKHPESDQFVTYVIHDHAAEILSMETDGVHELGVTPEVTLKSNSDEKTIIVKCYDASAPEAEIVFKDPGDTGLRSNPNFDDFTITSKSDWINVSGPEPHVDSDFNKNWDEDNYGKQFIFKISIGHNVYEDQSGEVTFYWKGLKRTVVINYEAEFLLHEVCEVELTIKDNDSNKSNKISNYWNFVTGIGTSGEIVSTSTAAADTPRLFGIKAENMTGGKKRTGGFHFPMPYGVNHKENPWEYVYKIDFHPLLNLEDTGSEITEITANFSEKTDAFIRRNVEWKKDETDKNVVYLSLEREKDSYQYAGGSIIFTVTHSKEGNVATSEIVASVYHTGFFHYEGNINYVPENDRGYYYYEVVPMGNEKDYWLDRNIGAKANTSFIDIEEKVVDRSSAGLMYTIAKPKTFKDNDFESGPTFDLGMCPPGYHIPNQTEWDALRLSKNLITRSVTYNNTLYMSTYYDTKDSKIGNIYLQKARFYNEPQVSDASAKYTSEPNAGDAGAGYYWTVTTAPAMEKEQMAAWLRALYLNGSSSTYNNASIADHRMPIRCKAGNAGEAADAKEYYISFNVHNVTHVFLFDVSTGKNTPLYTFPGKAVGTTASAEKWQNFYCSTTVDPKNLRMIFVKLEGNGKVTIHKRATKSGVSTFESTTSYSPSFLGTDYSWEVANAMYYDFCETALERKDDSGNLVTNVIPSLPEDCKTGEDNTGGDDNNGDDEDNVDLDIYTFKEEDPTKENIIDTNKHYLNKYDEKCQHLDGNFNWASIRDGAKLKIYTVNVGNGYNLQIFLGNWGTRLFDIHENDQRIHTSSKDNQVSVIEIELTQNLLDILRANNGMVLQGNKCVLLGLTIVPSAKALPSGEFNWTGEWDNSNWNNPFMNLSSTLYDWKDVEAGWKLTIKLKNYNNGQLFIRTVSPENSISGINDYVSWNSSINDNIEITLTETMINEIKQKGGIKFVGGAYVITSVKLTPQ